MAKREDPYPRRKSIDIQQKNPRQWAYVKNPTLLTLVESFQSEFNFSILSETTLRGILKDLETKIHPGI